MIELEHEAVHAWFSLSYSNYLVLPRTLLQSMPDEWQRRFVGCLDELQTAFDHLEHPPGYWVRARDESGRFMRDPIPHYDRGRARVQPSPGAAESE
jgi:hypothetical protein